MDNLSLTINKEQNPDTQMLSELPLIEMLSLLNQNDAEVPKAIKAELHSIEKVVNLITEQLRAGGRLFYVGAGTSGRLGVLDSAECPPTFGTDPQLIQSIIAGGQQAMLQAVENIEDCTDSAPNELQLRGLNSSDVVVGIAASGRTPFVLSGLEYAREVGAKTVAITTRGHGLVCEYADLSICPDVGPEVLAGSTRMKSGSAQKLLLGMISTSLMIQLGKVHGNLMIDVKPTNEKLRVRAQHMVMQICDVKESVAQRLLEDVGYSVRAAVLLHSLDISPAEAKAIASEPYRSLNEQLDQGK